MPLTYVQTKLQPSQPKCSALTTRRSNNDKPLRAVTRRLEMICTVKTYAQAQFFSHMSCCWVTMFCNITKLLQQICSPILDNALTTTMPSHCWQCSYNRHAVPFLTMLSQPPCCSILDIALTTTMPFHCWQCSHNSHAVPLMAMHSQQPCRHIVDNAHNSTMLCHCWQCSHNNHAVSFLSMLSHQPYCPIEGNALAISMRSHWWQCTRNIHAVPFFTIMYMVCWRRKQNTVF